MMERFNFYDIYGYFLPGALWLTLLGLPFILVSGFPSDRTAEITVGGLVLGYLAGLLLQNLARDFLPSTKRDATGKARYPSDLLLDEQDSSLSPALKRQIAGYVSKRFGIEVSDAADPGLGSREKRRDDAFRLCRTALAQGKVGSYAEQYQGLYSLMRGLAASCVLAILYYLGWFVALGFPLSGSLQRDHSLGMLVLALAAILIWLHAFRKRQPSLEFWLFGIMLATLGFLAGGWLHVAEQHSYILVAMTPLLVVVYRRSAEASRYFMNLFAESVYRDFLALSTAEDKDGPSD
jgi:hypothetical protein